MRTNYGRRATADRQKLLPEYESSVGAFVTMLEEYWGHEQNDPVKVAQVILQIASKEQLPAHLLLGSDALQYVRSAEQQRELDAKAWHDVSISIDDQNIRGALDLKL